MPLSKFLMLSAIGVALVVSSAAFPAHAEQSGSQPQPSPSPSPKSPLDQARDDVEAAAKDAAAAYKKYKEDLCDKNVSDKDRDRDLRNLKAANANLDLAIDHEASLSPDVKTADQQASDAAAAEEKVKADPNAPISDLFGLSKKTKNAKKNAEKTRTARTGHIRKRLTEGENGYVFGLPEEECKKPASETSPPPKDKPHPKPKKTGVSEDNPLYMDGYKAPANTKPSTSKKKSGDNGTGPSQDDVDRQTDQPSNDNDKQPEIPVPH